MRPDLADKSAERWEGWVDRTSLAFVEIVLPEATHAPEELVDYLDAPGDETIGELEQGAARLPFPASPPGGLSRPPAGSCTATSCCATTRAPGSTPGAARRRHSTRSGTYSEATG